MCNGYVLLLICFLGVMPLGEPHRNTDVVVGVFGVQKHSHLRIVRVQLRDSETVQNSPFTIRLSRDELAGTSSRKSQGVGQWSATGSQENHARRKNRQTKGRVLKCAAHLMCQGIGENGLVYTMYMK